MREIKFRAWGKNSKEYLGYGTKDGISLTLKNIQNIEDLGSWIFEQYTGLKDKNGKEIWEGDIVEGTMGTFEVKQYNTASRFGFKSNMAMDWHPSFVRNQANKMEIVGNIHKNPELLKEEK